MAVRPGTLRSLLCCEASSGPGGRDLSHHGLQRQWGQVAAGLELPGEAWGLLRSGVFLVLFGIVKGHLVGNMFYFFDMF